MQNLPYFSSIEKSSGLWPRLEFKLADCFERLNSTPRRRRVIVKSSPSFPITGLR